MHTLSVLGRHKEWKNGVGRDHVPEVHPAQGQPELVGPGPRPGLALNLDLVELKLEEVAPLVRHLLLLGVAALAASGIELERSLFQPEAELGEHDVFVGHSVGLVRQGLQYLLLERAHVGRGEFPGNALLAEGLKTRKKHDGVLFRKISKIQNALNLKNNVRKIPHKEMKNEVHK